MARVQTPAPARLPEPGAPQRSEVARGQVPAPPDAEVSAGPRRRTFTAQYKLEILDAVEAVRGTSEIGALLRREGLYSSHLTKWRSQRRAGALRGLAARRRGPPPAPSNPLTKRVAELERDNRQLALRLAQAESILEIQKKVSELLGIPLDRPASGGRTS